MSGSTARSDLGARLSETLQAYFEMKAASSLYRTAINGTQLRARDVLFKGLNQSSLDIFAGKRTVADLIERVALFCNHGELAYSSFLSQISHLEGFMGAVLRSKGESDSGTLGALQNRMLSFCIDASSDDVKSLDEVRERRNCLIHHSGNANQKYIDTLKVPGFLAAFPSVYLGDKVEIDGEYLSYVTEKIWNYSAQF